MRASFLWLARIIIVLTPVSAGAQTLSGNYSLKTPEGLVRMSLQETADDVTGAVVMEDGARVTLEGRRKGPEVVGIASTGGKQILFKLRPQSRLLIFTLIPLKADNQPDMVNSQEFSFSKQGQVDVREPARPAQPADGPVDEEEEGEGEEEERDADEPPDARNPLVPSRKPGLNPLARSKAPEPSDPWSGTFQNEQLTLHLEGNRGQYRGQIRFETQTLPVTAESSDGRNLRGKFTSGANSFDFVAKLDGAVVTLHTEGTSYQLRRESAASPGSASSTKQMADIKGPTAAPKEAGMREGSEVHDASLGLRFAAPPGWKHQKRQSLYIMGHESIPGMILILPHNFNSIQEAVDGANEPLYQGEDGQLTAAGTPETLAQNIVAAEYEGVLQGKQTRGRLVCTISPHGGGFLILAGADTQSYGTRHAQLAEGIARSMRFSKPQAPPEAEMWRQRLSGRRLAYLKSGGSSDIGGTSSWSDRADLYLCSNGAFHASGGFTGAFGASGGFGSARQGTGPLTGSWAIVGQAGQPALQIRLESGGTETFVLSTDGSRTFLNGTRFMVVENPVCP